MIVFPTCKINLGLNVLGKREDSFHNIETVFYPVNWCDALEIIEADNHSPFTLTTSGLKIDGLQESNLLYKTWELISHLKPLPPLKVHLHKNIPMGAGIGGGSSDAAFMTNLFDKQFNLMLSDDQKHEVTSALGSDCAFFLNNKPLFAQGRGNEFSPVNLDLSSYYILLVYPNIHSVTRDAFEGLRVKKTHGDLKNCIENTSINKWKDFLFNDFEEPIFKKYPVIGELKNYMYDSGALYASLSGSGSTVYGIFENKPVMNIDRTYKSYLQIPQTTHLPPFKK
ncbi:MAG: 4-(cytidine 5-diphospho)-2-C-methyl-D-erythritol kinase [Bacteroidetes bacterium]|nr:4-(cytidine 5-diphospho)-2-C-methyl-D-erythritol kinase [Bacteroidota bacterium]